jgi:hypothetical protein
MAAPVPAQAALISGFQGPYDPANWTLETNGGTGSVNTSGAPNSIVLTGSDSNSGSQVLTNFTTSAANSGFVSFQWSYSTSDGPQYDRFGYILNGLSTEITDRGGGTSQSGTLSFAVATADVFGFSIDAIDDCCGFGSVTLSSFNAPAPVPVPGPLPVFGAVSALAAGRRLRRLSHSLRES